MEPASTQAHSLQKYLKQLTSIVQRCAPVLVLLIDISANCNEVLYRLNVAMSAAAKRFAEGHTQQGREGSFTGFKRQLCSSSGTRVKCTKCSLQCAGKCLPKQVWLT